MTQLKPCPFCGGSAEKHKCSGSEVDGYADEIKYICVKCGCRMGAKGATNPSGGYAINKTVEKRALLAWNTRTDTDRIAELEAQLKTANFAVLTLSKAYSDWPMQVNDEDEVVISNLIKLIESSSNSVCDASKLPRLVEKNKSDDKYCEKHRRFPCRECGTKHYDGCECSFCK